MINFKFKKDFWWGTATSGPQTEGWTNKKSYSLMDEWFKKEPEQFFEKVGNDVANDMYLKFKEDIDIMSYLKLNSFRTSIQWTRLVNKFPFEKLDQEGVDFYKKYFTYLKEKNIKVIVNLYHFDLPMPLQDQGGWENKDTIEEFRKYAKACFLEFGDLVDYWASFNEPIVHSECGYYEGNHYPHIKNLKRAIQVGFNITVASARAIKEFKKIFKDKKEKKIGVILNLTPCYSSSNNEEDLKASKIADYFYNKSFLDPSVKGEYNKEFLKLLNNNNLSPHYKIKEIVDIKNNTVDYLGVNYYQPRRFKKPTNNESDGLEKFFENYIWKERIMNESRGWEIYPKALYDIAINLKNNYNNIKWLVSENGMGVQEESSIANKSIYIEDDYRIRFISEHLYWLHKSIEEGSNCFGYHLWSFTDCWSWNNAYKNRYGFVAINLNNLERKIKKSGYWIKNTIEKDNEIELNKLIYKEFISK
ncbi:6-phospho-beta-glucosidase [Spiroplasma gladiatoris]|uniref:6-phospho-beta-glucosidase n=1 Tax=Spiroplasma gladiatoris TaxID=2143 RepID=A0A4P7AJQ4_9MOLU|nr:glycoside hydrolase family 1 protein [Spiroplasma gladiatoris]QBQ07770.1 6-phospho-beta-glucosidase [Spiroplasma gladiatoris]